MSQPGASGLTPPGWYPDSSGSQRLRWWDGTQWTEHFAPMGGQNQPLRAPEGTSPNTPWIWIAAFLPLLGLLDIPFLLTFYSRIFAAVESDPTGVAAAEFAPDSGYFALQGLGILLYAVFVVLAALDYRALNRRGVPRPFSWAWTFLGAIIYIIGRGIVVRRRTGTGLAPLWVGVTTQVVAVIAIMVVTFASIGTLIGAISTS